MCDISKKANQDSIIFFKLLFSKYSDLSESRSSLSMFLDMIEERKGMNEVQDVVTCLRLFLLSHRLILDDVDMIPLASLYSWSESVGHTGG